MKIVIIWDSASGKSIFGHRLAKKIGIPVYHTDLIRINPTGEEMWNKFVQQEISKLIQKQEWIIEWNALRADPEQRIKEADQVFLFDFNKTTTLYNVWRRWIKTNTGKEQRHWFHENDKKNRLSLLYRIPYIFINFPRRKKELKFTIKKYNKQTTIFRSYNDINKYYFENIINIYNMTKKKEKK